MVSVYTKSEDESIDPAILCDVPAAYQTVAGQAFASGIHSTEADAPTIGADLTKFDGWSWASVNGKY